MAGDVGDEEAGLLAIGDEEVVEVAGDGGHGNVAGGDLKVVGLGIGQGENRGLDAACDFEFFLNFAELVVAREAALRGYVAEGCEEEGEAERFDIVKGEPGCR